MTLDEFIKSKKGFLLSSGILFSGSMLDVLTTDYGLSQGLREDNPIVKSLIDNGGIESFYLVKGMLAAGLIALGYKSPLGRYCSLTGGFIDFGFAISNVAELFGKYS